MRWRVRFFVAAQLLLSASGAAVAEGPDVTTGGVGLDARERMKDEYARYNLHIAFANRKGEFLADVKVSIRDAGGKELWRGASEGPLLFARLPVGNYEIIAEHRAVTITRWVKARDVPGLLNYFHWMQR